ncbi:PREDICTED: cardio acceleratory peptide 2b-like [Rhagoletis zephyria]|uniref:cardio acceleratory peptide 2b-like n=1 Tax=Rhagoletis zephyria TaxID=28612 RepID=UPI0008119355|nr:PREDICTED: cardio acceleratory peptide 2b-like [Rhagoletis zephyria]XP_017479093.1 PREDICTED: cardio acceleratory peptide 2b-like [Rhagoletis zephyria]
MKSFYCLDFIICSTVVVVALAGFSEAELDQKNRRTAGGPSGLIAFPRVGRSDPNLVNNLHEADISALSDGMYPASLEDYEVEYPKSEIKRASLIAFPRVGRTDAELRKWARIMALQQALNKGTGPSATSGLWFGPRLGKRSVDAQVKQQQQHNSKASGQKELY